MRARRPAGGCRNLVEVGPACAYVNFDASLQIVLVEKRTPGFWGVRSAVLMP